MATEFYESELKNNEGEVVGKFAFFFDGASVERLDKAIEVWAGRENYNSFMVVSMDNPWVRIAVIGINELPMKEFNALPKYKFTFTDTRKDEVVIWAESIEAARERLAEKIKNPEDYN